MDDVCQYPRCDELVDAEAPPCCVGRYCAVHWKLNHDAPGVDGQPIDRTPWAGFALRVLNHLPTDRRAPWRRDPAPWRRGIWAKG